ncbi:hypothetical protein HQ587_08830 [bacterium]|nr:hypothetical protein [bacterium]
MSILIILLLALFITGCDNITTPTHSNNQVLLQPPTDLTAIAVSPTEIKLTWVDLSTGEAGHEVFESVNCDTSFVLIKQTGINAESVILEGKSQNSSYYYTVRAFNESGYSDFSSIASVRGGELLLVIDTGDSPVLSVAYSPQGNIIVAGCGDYIVRIYNSITGELLQILSDLHTHPVISAAYSPDSSRFATGDQGGIINVWNVEKQRVEYSMRGYSRIDKLEFSPDGSFLVSGYSNLCIWDMTDGSLFNIITGEREGNLIGFAYHPSGDYLVVSEGSRISVWDSHGIDTVMTKTRYYSTPTHLAFHPDGDYFVGARGSAIGVWSFVEDGGSVTIDSLTVLDSLNNDGHTWSVFAFDFSPDGLLLASGSRDHTVKIWDGTDFTLLATLIAHDPAVYCLDFRPDGIRLASGGGDTVIKIWSTFF